VVIAGVIGGAIALSLIFPKAAMEDVTPEDPVVDG
jgi:hypothetical protein